MNAGECPREHEVVSAVLLRRWPHGCDEDLRAHAAECAVCQETVTVAALLHEDGQAERREVQVPAAGQVWWRAAIRARVEAVQAAERPMTWLHGVAGACAVGIVAALAGAAWPLVATWFSERSWSLSVGAIGALVVSLLQRSLPLVILAAAFVILAPIAIYFAMSDE
jgi:hypothetical protein